jgi:cytochrome c556
MPVRVRLLRRAAVLGAALAALALALAAAGPAVAGATSASKTALLNGESVTTFDGITKGEEPISLEQYAAEQAGFTVTVKSGPEWEAMTAPEFAS